MRRTTFLLSALLLVTNAMWWLGGHRPPLAAAGPEREQPTAADQGDANGGADPRLQQLEDELQKANTRIRELEAAQQRTPVPTPAAEQSDDAKRKAAARQASADRLRRVQQLAQEWTTWALQTGDVTKRDEAIAAIRNALLNGDPAMVEAALRALARLRELDYDKASFRDLVAPCLQSPDGGIRAAAMYALFNTDPRPEDLPTLLAMVDDQHTGVRGSLAHILMLWRRGAMDGAAADVALRLLGDRDEQVRRQTQSGLWGANPDPRIEDHYLGLLADPQRRHDAIYFGLSTFDPKSPRVVAALLEALADPDPNNAERARWGLSHGVPAESQPAVADAFLRLLETRSAPSVQSECIQQLQRFGTVRHVPALEAFAARPGVNAALRQQLEQLLAVLRSR